MHENSIAIVAMDCVVPGAATVGRFWRNLVEGVDAVVPVPHGRLNGRGPESPFGSRGGFLTDVPPFNPLAFGVVPKTVADADPDQLLMLELTRRSLEQAGLEVGGELAKRTDVIIGRGGYMTNQMSEIYLQSDFIDHLTRFLRNRLGDLPPERVDALVDELGQVTHSNVDSVSTCIPNLVASRIANRFDLGGSAYCVDAACASSLVAVEQAVRRLRDGSCDLALVGGVHLLQTPSFWSIFQQLGAISRSGHIRPFSQSADGLVLGEAAGLVVLKRYQDAVQDGNRVYAKILGVGLSSDARNSALLTPNWQGQVASLDRAYQDAQVSRDTVEYLETHGTATPVGDAVELQTIREFFGPPDRFPPRRCLGTVKSMVGHTMPAAGIVSLIKTALMLSNKTLVPSLHCDRPRSELDETQFFINRECRPWLHDPAEGPRRAGINAFGFGGVNAHVVLEEVTDAARAFPVSAGSDRPSELVVLTAASQPEMRQQLVDLGHELTDLPAHDFTDVAFTINQRRTPAHRVKLAIVASDLPHLTSQLEHAAEQLERDQPSFKKQSVIYYSASADRAFGKVAGIFPGIGFPGLIGSYPDHLLDMCRLFPEVRDVFDRAERRDRDPDDPLPTGLIFSPPSTYADDLRLALRERLAAMTVIETEESVVPDIPKSERNLAASGITLSNWVSWRLLQELAVPVDMLCGQSQGELAALCAAEILDIDTVLPRFWQALAIAPSYAGKGRLAFICSSADQLQAYLERYPTAEIAIHVAPQMLIVGGTDDDLDSLVDELRQDGVIANLLPFPPIHSPQLSHMRDELYDVVDMNFDFQQPKIPVYSAVSEAPFPDEESEIRELMLSNLDRPVRFWQTIHRLYDDGARVFVQVGGGSMSANIQSILPKPDIVGTAIDVDHRSPLTQLQHMCATLLVHGIDVNVDYLFQTASPRQIDLAAEPADTTGSRQSVPLRLDWVPFDGAPTTAGVVSSSTPQRADTAENAAVTEGPPLETTTLQESGDDADKQADAGTGAADVSEQEDARRLQESAMAEESPFPFVDRIVSLVPEREIETQRVLDLDRDLHLHDHVLIDPWSQKRLESRMPVLPMTMMLEVASETAAHLAPGRGLVGFKNVHALRWIDFPDTRQVRLRLKGAVVEDDAETGVRNVEIHVLDEEGQKRASLQALFAESYPHQMQLALSPLENPRSWPLTAAEAYAERHMFHGPRFHCVREFHVLADNGLTCELEVLPRDDLFVDDPSPFFLLDPVVLDGVLQSVGMWAIVNQVYVLPAKVQEIEFYSPPPPVGTRAHMAAEITEFASEQRTLTSNVEVTDGEGNLWFRMRGVSEWLFDYSDELQDTQRLPWTYHISARYTLPEVAGIERVVTRLDRKSLRHVNLEWVARLYLHEAEWEEFRELRVLRRQWEWLMGRVAVKDAARLYFACQDPEPEFEMIHPAVVQILTDENRRPYLAPLDIPVPMPSISLAHTDTFAVAIASNQDCGIDSEPVSRDVQAAVDYAITSEIERMLLARLTEMLPEEHWELRFWCAKEAVAKRIGTGLMGRPAAFEVVEAAEDGQIVIRVRTTGDEAVVTTFLDDPLVVAIT